jgi:hypothetical protein
MGGIVEQHYHGEQSQHELIQEHKLHKHPLNLLLLLLRNSNLVLLRNLLLLHNLLPHNLLLYLDVVSLLLLLDLIHLILRSDNLLLGHDQTHLMLHIHLNRKRSQGPPLLHDLLINR